MVTYTTAAEVWADFEYTVSSGALPEPLRWHVASQGPQSAAERYGHKTPLPRDYSGWLEMWRGICWVRYQAFEREAETCAQFIDWEQLP